MKVVAPPQDCCNSTPPCFNSPCDPCPEIVPCSPQPKMNCRPPACCPPSCPPPACTAEKPPCCFDDGSWDFPKIQEFFHINGSVQLSIFLFRSVCKPGGPSCCSTGINVANACAPLAENVFIPVKPNCCLPCPLDASMTSLKVNSCPAAEAPTLCAPLNPRCTSACPACDPNLPVAITQCGSNPPLIRFQMFQGGCLFTGVKKCEQITAAINPTHYMPPN